MRPAVTYTRHSGWSLIELIIVIAILGIMFGLVLAAVQRVRQAALRTTSENHLRQIALATHQLAGDREGRVKGLTQAVLPIKPFYSESSIFDALLPYLLGQRTLPPNPTPAQIGEYLVPTVKIYISPADTTYNANPGYDGLPGKCSYAANMLAFDGSILIPFSVQDGMSSTLAFSERYHYCGLTQEPATYPYIFAARPGIPVGGERRATFADKGWFDVMPVKDPFTGQTVASRRGVTFQLRPTVDEADSKMLQTPHPSGLPVALFDGSVRTLSPSIAEHIFWGMITPNGGEVISPD